MGNSVINKKSIIAAMVVFICAVSLPATAAPGDWYFTTQGEYADPDSDRGTDDGLGVTLRLGKQLMSHLDLELVGAGVEFDRDVEPRHEYLYNLGLDALVVFNRGGFSPHLAFGGGGVYNDTRFDDGYGGYVNAGLGVRVPIIENGLKMRFDARYFVDFTDGVIPGEDNFGDVRLSLGVELPLGGAAAPVVTDSDNDGVPNDRDRCPNTPQGVSVGSDGCPLDSDGDGVPDFQDNCPNTPAGVSVGSDGCPLDSDGDGVPDSLDECPGTAPGVPVNSAGCPQVIDSDGDGVPDDRDQCPDTPPGTRVLTNGCGVGQSAILQGVNFEFNKAVLTSTARQILRNVAQTLRDSPGFQVEIEGHTDSIGSSSYNLELSQRRADSVKQFLVEQGASANRLYTRGYGETRPIASNDTDPGRATNRRVELRVVRDR